MNVSNGRIPGGALQKPWIWITMLVVTLLLAGCGGGSSGSSQPEPPAAATCVPSDPATADACGTLLLGLTDADGDFLSYTVDVTSLTLTRANGAVVETLPNSTRIDFAQYVDLTEFVSAANVPPGTYVSGEITLDYSNAEIVVEAGMAAKDAIAVDASGAPLAQETLTIMLSDRNQLVITRGRPALLTVDFDLAASHVVDTAATPATATAEPFILAELDPVDTKDFRVRGVFIDADEAAMTYTVALRPFHLASGDFGRFTVHVTDTTEFEVNEELWTGIDGLRALSAAGTGTLTVAHGTLDVAAREYTADLVLAGDSVPGADLDAVRGNVIARNGDELTVRGATVILNSEQRAFFRDDVTVLIGPDTKVFQRGHDGLLDPAALSVGQGVTVRGTVTATDPAGIVVDATAGAVRMHITRLTGIASSIGTGQVDIALRSIDRRPVDLFDFSGTGQSAELDADPMNYEVATFGLPLSQQAVGLPVAVAGFPSAFGTAPPDFEGRTVVDFADVRSFLGIGWGSEGTIAPFLSINTDGLLLDNGNMAIDERHFIKQGPVFIDLSTLDSDTLIVPPASGRSVYAIKTRDSLQLYANFADFSNALALALNGATAARSMHARGLYDASSNTFTAWSAGVYLLEP